MVTAKVTNKNPLLCPRARARTHTNTYSVAFLAVTSLSGTALKAWLEHSLLLHSSAHLVHSRVEHVIVREPGQTGTHRLVAFSNPRCCVVSQLFLGAQT